MLEYQPLIKQLSFLGLVCAFLLQPWIGADLLRLGPQHCSTETDHQRVLRLGRAGDVLSHRFVAKMYWCQTQTFSHSPERDSRFVTQRFSWFKSSRRSRKPPHLATKSPFAAIFKDKLLACSLRCLTLRWLNEFIVLPPLYLTIFLQVTLDC